MTLAAKAKKKDSQATLEVKFYNPKDFDQRVTIQDSLVHHTFAESISIAKGGYVTLDVMDLDEDEFKYLKRSGIPWEADIYFEQGREWQSYSRSRGGHSSHVEKCTKSYINMQQCESDRESIIVTGQAFSHRTQHEW